MNNERVTPKNAAKELQMDVITLRELMKREKLPIGYAIKREGNMQKLKQMVVMRESHERDEGTMGFHDYVTVKEDFNKFVDRVTEACETVNGKFLGVSYPTEDTAVILYRWSDGLHYIFL